MCLMAPARVVAVDGAICEVEVGGRVDKASMMLEPDLVVGDWVLVNSGTVVRKLDEEQAAEMAHAFGVLYGLTDMDGEPLAEADAGSAAGAGSAADAGFAADAGSAADAPPARESEAPTQAAH